MSFSRSVMTPPLSRSLLMQSMFRSGGAQRFLIALGPQRAVVWSLRPVPQIASSNATGVVVVARAADFGGNAAACVHITRARTPVRIVALFVARRIGVTPNRRGDEAETEDPLSDVPLEVC